MLLLLAAGALAINVSNNVNYHVIVKTGMSVLRHLKRTFQFGDEICVSASLKAEDTPTGTIIGFIPESESKTWSYGFTNNEYCGLHPAKRFSDIQSYIDWSRLEPSDNRILSYEYCSVITEATKAKIPFIYVCDSRDRFTAVSLSLSPYFRDYTFSSNRESLGTIYSSIFLALMSISAVIWICLCVRKFTCNHKIHAMIIASIIVSVAARVAELMLYRVNPDTDIPIQITDTVFCALMCTEQSLILLTLALVLRGWCVIGTVGLFNERGNVSLLPLLFSLAAGILMNVMVNLLICAFCCVVVAGYVYVCWDGLKRLGKQITAELEGMKGGLIDPETSILNKQYKLLQRIGMTTIGYLVLYNMGTVIEFLCDQAVWTPGTVHGVSNLVISVILMVAFHPSENNMNLYIKAGEKMEDELMIAPETVNDMQDVLDFVETKSDSFEEDSLEAGDIEVPYPAD